MTKCLRLALVAYVAIIASFTAKSQNVSINNSGATADPSGILDVSSTTKGVLVPRMDKTQKNAIVTPANALLVYQTGPDSVGFHYYDAANTRWVFINASGFSTDTTAWKITGNSNITSANFLGTTNDTALRFRVRNAPSGIIDSIRANTALGFRGLGNLTTGVNNTSFGAYSAPNLTTGNNNIVSGINAAFSTDTASNTTAIGTNSLYFNKHNNNFAVGSQAGTYMDLSPITLPSIQNTFVGTEAGYGFHAIGRSTALGYRALYNQNGGTVFGSTLGRNVAIGDSAMAWTYSSRNVAVGVEALSRARVSSQNVAIGDSAMGNALSTVGNVAVGYKALNSQINQGFNTAVGYFSQRDSSKDTYYNTSIGAFSMEFNRIGLYNTGLGLSAMRLADSTSYNTAIGADAMYFRRKNGSNVAVGAFAQRGDSAGFWNTAVGSEAMDRYAFDGTAKGTGFSNVAVGFRALRQVREGWENTAVGVGALESDSSGNYNTAIGRYSGFLNKRGDHNTSLGFRAAQNGDTASFTTIIGSQAGYHNKVDSNVAIGYRSGYFVNNNISFISKEQTFVGSAAGMGSSSSSKNTALGHKALAQETSPNFFQEYGNGGRNTAIGANVLSRAAGISNVGVGADVMSNAGTQIFQNVAMGDSAMGNSDVVVGNNFDNVAIGYKSLTQVRNHGNVTMGAYSGRKLANTVWNTAIGYHALEVDTTGSENTVIGTSAFRNNFNGIRNTSLGINTGFWNTSSNNTFLGSYAGEGINGRSTGGSNTAVGFVALTNIRSGTQNVAVGEGALASDSSGSLNVAVGAGSFESHLLGNDNVAIGFWAGRNDTASIQNVLIGRDAGYNNNRSNIIAIGYQALYNNSLGASTLNGVDNTAIGTLALSTNVSGNYNVALGNNSLQVSTASFNTGIGHNTLLSNTTGGSNTAVGSNALTISTTASANTALGTNAMFNTTTGASNTGLGFQSLFLNSSGRSNTAIGKHSGYTNTIGNKLTLVGDSADVAANNLDNATAIGYRAQVGANNSLVLGGINGVNGATANTLVGIGTTTPLNSKLNIVDTISTFSRNAAHIIGNNATIYTANGATLFVENTVTSGASSTAILAENENTTAGFGFGGFFKGQYAIAAEVTSRPIPNGNNTKGLQIRNNTLNTGTHYGAEIFNQAANANTNYGTYSYATGASSANYGVFALSANAATNNYGTYGQASGGTSFNAGVWGNALGASTTNYGVLGQASGATNNYGVYCSGSGGYTGTWTMISDQKFKKDVTQLNSVLPLLNKVQTYSYNTKNDEFSFMNFSKQLQFGYIAQDLEKYFPNLVEEGSHPGAKKEDPEIKFKSVNYIGMIPVLTKAIQEQQTQIETQSKENEALKKKNEQLEADIKAIKAKLGIQ